MNRNGNKVEFGKELDSSFRVPWNDELGPFDKGILTTSRIGSVHRVISSTTSRFTKDRILNKSVERTTKLLKPPLNDEFNQKEKKFPLISKLLKNPFALHTSRSQSPAQKRKRSILKKNVLLRPYRNINSESRQLNKEKVLSKKQSLFESVSASETPQGVRKMFSSQFEEVSLGTQALSIRNKIWKGLSLTSDNEKIKTRALMVKNEGRTSSQESSNLDDNHRTKGIGIRNWIWYIWDSLVLALYSINLFSVSVA